MELSLRSLALLLLFAPLAPAQVSPPRTSQAPELVLVPFLPGQARVLTTVDVALLVYAPDASHSAVTLEELEVVAGGDVIHQETLSHRLVGDPRYGEINALIERFPRELTELNRDRRYFADEALPELAGEELLAARQEVAERWNELAYEYNAGVPLPFAQLEFPLPYDQLFFTDDPPGTRAELELRVRYSGPGGIRGTAVVTKTVTRLAAPLPPPATLLSTAGVLTLHAGDLHVHSCHGEAANACAPSTDCAAEVAGAGSTLLAADRLKWSHQQFGCHLR